MRPSGLVATEKACEFFDAGSAACTSHVDGVMDEDQHLKLGGELARVVQALLLASASDSRV